MDGGAWKVGDAVGVGEVLAELLELELGGRVVRLPDETAEADFVAREIGDLLEEDFTPSDVAVFYRVNALSRLVEERFARHGLPYQLVGAVAFYQRKEVRDVLAYLKVLANPADEVSLRRIINVPPRGIGRQTLARLEEFALSEGIPLAEALRRHEEVPGLGSRAQAALERFQNILDDLTRLDTAAVDSLLLAVVERTGYADALRHSDDPVERERMQNVEQLLAAAREYCELADQPSLAGFLERVALVNDQDAYQEGAERVTLMTLHAAKGLEFPVVFIIGVEEEILPHRRRESEGDLEEERRLFFVGITRAKELLYLTHCAQRAHQGRHRPASPSSFLAELPPETCQHEDRAAGIERAFRQNNRIEPTPDEETGLERWEFTPGMLVRSPAFGVGRVIAQNGIGENARVLIRFNTLGEKVLLVRHAKLEKLG